MRGSWLSGTASRCCQYSRTSFQSVLLRLVTHHRPIMIWRSNKPYFNSRSGKYPAAFSRIFNTVTGTDALSERRSPVLKILRLPESGRYVVTQRFLRDLNGYAVHLGSHGNVKGDGLRHLPDVIDTGQQ